ncbi:MAG: protein kinase [Planctomycetota bacterium]
MSERPPAAPSESGAAEPDPDSDDLLKLFERFLARMEGGSSPSVEELVSLHPQHERELRAIWRERGPGSSSGRFFGRSKREAPPPRSLQPGDRLGDVRLERFIAKGGMGEVWEGVQDSLERRVALKVVRPDKETDRARLRFELEAIAGARMNHPGIVAVYGHGDTDGVGWISMEYVDGCWTLFDYLSGLDVGAPLPPEHFRDVARLLLKITDAMQAAHAASVIHRDLKPQNVLITPADEPKVADFGLARLMDVPGISEPGDLVGSYYYMSPEQVTADRIELDHRTDVFSLGVIAYELLTLKRPFEGATAKAVSRQIVLKDPPEPRKVRREIPRVLDVLTMRCLEKDPDDRFYSMAVLGEQLRLYLAGEPVPIEPVGPVRRAWRRLKRDRTRVAALAGVALVAVAVWLATEVMGERGARVDAELEALYSDAERRLELNDVGAVRRLMDRAIELDSADPKAHMLMAHALTKFGRIPERDRELELAMAKGFEPLEPQSLDGEALEHLTSARVLLLSRDAREFPDALTHMERAVALEPERYTVHYERYLIHAGMDEHEAARDALLAFQARLATGNPFWTLAAALGHELDGDLDAALVALESLYERDDVDQRMLRDLRVDRTLARIHVDAGRLDEALPFLERAIQEPRDCPSHDAYTVYCYRLYQLEDADADLLRRVRDAALSALECSPTLIESRVIHAFAEIESFARSESVSAPPRSSREWLRARDALDELVSRHPNEPRIPRLESKLLYAEGEHLVQLGDDLGAAGCYIRSTQVDGREIRPWIGLTDSCVWICESLQSTRPGLRVSSHALAPLTRISCDIGLRLFSAQLHRLGLGAAERAYELWVSASDRATRSLFADFAVWGFAHALPQGDASDALLWRKRIDEQLDSTLTMTPAAWVNYAEYLGLLAPHDCVRDLQRAKSIVARHVDAFVGVAEERQFRRIIETILNTPD